MAEEFQEALALAEGLKDVELKAKIEEAKKFTAKMERCIQHLKDKGFSKERAIAICMAVLHPKGEAYEGQIKLAEKLSWVRPLLKSEVEGGKIYQADVVHVGMSMNKNVYSEEELKLAARSLVYRPISINHERWLPYPANLVIDAEYEDGAVEALFKIADEETQRAIEGGAIAHVSIEALARETEQVDGLALKGLAFTGLALLTKDQPPGDPLTSIIVMEKAKGGGDEMEGKDRSAPAEQRCPRSHINPDGSFKGGFDGCVEHMTQCRGLPEENARRLCAWIGRKWGKIP